MVSKYKDRTSFRVLASLVTIECIFIAVYFVTKCDWFLLGVFVPLLSALSFDLYNSGQLDKKEKGSS